MSQTILANLDRAIAALTVSEYEVHGVSPQEAAREKGALLNRSVGRDLIDIERILGARGKTLLSGIGAGIDEALLELAAARAELAAAPGGNLKPAPDFLNGAVTKAVLEGTEGPETRQLPVKRKAKKPTPAPEPKAPKAPVEEPLKKASEPRKNSAPSNPAARRQAMFRGAELFLKRKGILVTVVDRAAPIRTYRVTGKREAQLLEEVVELAIAKGWDASEAEG